MRLNAHATPYSILQDVGGVGGRLRTIEQWFLDGAEIDDAAAGFGLVRRYAWTGSDGRLGAADYFGIVDGSHAVWAELKRIRPAERLTCGRILVDGPWKGRGLGRALYRHMVLTDSLELMSGPNHTQHSKRMYEGFARDADLIVDAVDPRTDRRFEVRLGEAGIEVDGGSIYRHEVDLRLVVKRRRPPPSQ